MILAAGFGTRLWPLTVDRTKPSVPFLNKPLISHSVEYLHRFGVDEIVINLHHQGDSIRQALGSGEAFGVKIYYSQEEEILGTSGGLDHARNYFQDATFVVMNGKVITDLDLSAALKHHKERRALATLILKENLNYEKFSTVLLNEDGNIRGFGAYPENRSSSLPLMFTGIQVMEPEIFNYIPRNCFSHSTTDVYPKAIAEGKVIAAYTGTGVWQEFSTLARYLNISLEYLHQQGQNRILGKDSSIAEGALVSNSILWDRVRVETGAFLQRVVVGDDVSIPAGTKLENAVVVRRDKCKEIEKGEVVGENLVVKI